MVSMIPERLLTARSKLQEAVRGMGCELPDDDSSVVKAFNIAYTEYVTGKTPLTSLRKAFQTFRDAVFRLERKRWKQEIASHVEQ